MRSSDWSSDVCSSDLLDRLQAVAGLAVQALRHQVAGRVDIAGAARVAGPQVVFQAGLPEVEARKSGVEGKSVAVRVDLGGSRNIKQKTNDLTPQQPTQCSQPLCPTLSHSDLN